MVCPTCGDSRPGYSFIDREAVAYSSCSGCRFAQTDHEQRINRLDEYVSHCLFSRGLSRRELKATREKIPALIRSAIPKEALSSLVSGLMPDCGFGLGGNTGGGKTMAIAAILRHAAAAQVKEYQPKSGFSYGGALTGLRWASWPDEVSWLRSHAIDPAAAERVEELSHTPLLVLDDLGRERIKGSYTDDWAASQLDMIVNHRYRNEMPILWTTNITELDLVNLYGSAMLRRLAADNPLIWIDGLKVAQ